jgi:hypothetical protein
MTLTGRYIYIYIYIYIYMLTVKPKDNSKLSMVIPWEAVNRRNKAIFIRGLSKLSI